MIADSTAPLSSVSSARLVAGIDVATWITYPDVGFAEVTMASAKIAATTRFIIAPTMKRRTARPDSWSLRSFHTPDLRRPRNFPWFHRIEMREMDEVFAVLGRWGYVILAAFVLAEQVPLPVPAVPVLLGIGALAADGRMSMLVAVLIACAAAMPIDLLWRRVGAVRGIGALRFVCRLSLEPASCLRRSETLFARYGSRALLVAKFLPGLTALVPALAGMVKVPLARFLIFDLAGVVLWAGTWMSLGYLFSRTLDVVLAQISRAGSVVGVLATGFVVYVLLKMVRRRRFLQRLRTARITAVDLKAMLDRGEDVWIADLRSGVDVEASPYTIPGARWLSTDVVAGAAADIPRDREIILVCT